MKSKQQTAALLARNKILREKNDEINEVKNKSNVRDQTQDPDRI